MDKIAGNSFVLFGIFLYMLLMLGIGFIASRKVAHMSDFLVAGRSLPFYLAFATLFATWFGSGTCLGASGTAYNEGLRGVVSDPFAAGIALVLAGFFYVKLLRRLNLLTVTDIFGMYYGPRSEIAASLLMIPVYIGWLGSQLIGLGHILHLLTDMPVMVGILVGAVIVLIYTYSGGMWAVTLTDFVQFIFLVVGLSILFPLVIKEVGGFQSLFQNTPSEFWSFIPQEQGYHDRAAYWGHWALMGLGVIVGQDLIQRSLASKNEKVAQSSAICAGIFYVLIGSMPVLMGIAGRMIIPDLENSEMILPMLATKFLHPLGMVIFLSALISIIMSSADSAMLAASSLLTHNVINKVYPSMKDETLLKTTRISMVILTVLATALALYVKEIYSLMINSWATLLVAILVPVTAALYWKKANREAAWVSMICGTGVWLFYTILSAGHFLDATDNLLAEAALYGGIASLLSYLLVTFFRYSKIKDVKPARAYAPES